MTKRYALFFAICALAVLAVVGCKKSLESQVVGTWTGSMQLPKDAAENPMAKMLQGMLTFKLDVKTDKTFSMTVAFVPMEGTWDTAGDHLNLHIEKAMGMDKAQLKDMAAKQGKDNPKAQQDMDKMDQPIEMSLSPDGKTLTVTNKGALNTGQAQGDLVFTREDNVTPTQKSS